jgi:acetyltransferase-like isoleucine patch superfamily enzyme
MSGRNLFNTFDSVINVFVILLSWLPKNLRMLFWDWTNAIPGIVGIGVRYCVLKSLCKKCGKNVLIGTNVGISGFQGLEIGSNVSIHRQCYIEAEGGVTIGSNVSIAHQTSILSTNHSWDDESLPIKYNKLKPAKVFINDDVWIGCGVRVLAGVLVDKRSVIAAGAIVTKDVQKRTVVGGNPARLLKNF